MNTQTKKQLLIYLKGLEDGAYIVWNETHEPMGDNEHFMLGYFSGIKNALEVMRNIFSQEEENDGGEDNESN